MFRKLRRVKNEISAEEAKLLLKNNKRAAFPYTATTVIHIRFRLISITMKRKTAFISTARKRP